MKYSSFIFIRTGNKFSDKRTTESERKKERKKKKKEGKIERKKISLRDSNLFYFYLLDI
jgi:hypothetical protein